MKIYKAFKYRLEPSDEQQIRLCQFAGSARFVWNKALALQKELGKNKEKRLSFSQLCNIFLGVFRKQVSKRLQDCIQ